MNISDFQKYNIYAVRLFSGYKRYILALGLMGLISGVLEGVGVSAIVPFFSIIVNKAVVVEQTSDALSKGIIAILQFFNFDIRLRYIGALIISVFILKAVILTAFEYIRSKIVSEYERNTRKTLYEKTLFAPWSITMKQKVGHLENMIMTDVGNTTKLLSGVASLSLTIVSLVIYSFIALSVDVRITLLAAATGVFLSFFSKPLSGIARRCSKDMVSLNKIVAHKINENLLGLKSIKAMGVEKEASSEVALLFDSLRNIKVKQGIVVNLFSAWLQPISAAFVFLVFSVMFLQPGFNMGASRDIK